MNIDIFTLLCGNFDKLTQAVHSSDAVSSMTSYIVPTKSEFPGVSKMVFFGISKYVQDLEDAFESQFFRLPMSTLRDKLLNIYRNQLAYPDSIDGLRSVCIQKFEDLHALQYLPVKIKAVPEGTLVPVGCPCVEITTTHPDFAWVGHIIESSIITALWHPSLTATASREFFKLALDAWEHTVDCDVPHIDPRLAMYEVAAPGCKSLQEAANTSLAWLTAMRSSNSTSGVDAMKKYYSHTLGADAYGYATVSNTSIEAFAIAEGYSDYLATYKHMLKLYRNVPIIMCCDKPSLWKVVTDILPECPADIYARSLHSKPLGICTESGDALEVLCGKVHLLKPYSIAPDPDCNLADIPKGSEVYRVTFDGSRNQTLLDFSECHENVHKHELYKIATVMESGEEVVGTFIPTSYESIPEQPGKPCVSGVFISDKRPRTAEEKGLVEALYDLFHNSMISTRKNECYTYEDSTYNCESYKSLAPGVLAVHNGHITCQKAKKIYRLLRAKDFAADSVLLGIDAYGLTHVEDMSKGLVQLSEETFGLKAECSYMVYAKSLPDGSLVAADSKIRSADDCSLEGKYHVWFDSNYCLQYSGNHTQFDSPDYRNNALLTVFNDGVVTRQDFNEVRRRIRNCLD